MRIDHQQRLLSKELRKLLPANKDDVPAVKAIAAHGYPAVQPIVGDLLKWIRVESWPVAKPVCEFLVSIGSQLTPQVHEALGSRDDQLKAAVLRRIVSEWSSDDVRVPRATPGGRRRDSRHPRGQGAFLTGFHCPCDFDQDRGGSRGVVRSLGL